MFAYLGILDPTVFVVGTVLIILAPGPNSLYVLRAAMRGGVADGYRAAAAIFIGDGILMLLASLGVDSLFRLYPATFLVLQYAGAAYLVSLGIRALYGALYTRPGEGGGNGQEGDRERPFRRALLLSLSNPKAIMFFVSFFVQFVDVTKGHPGPAFLVLACIVQVISMTYLSFLIFCGAKLAALTRGNDLLRRMGGALAGAVFLGFGLRLVLKAGE